MKIELLGQRFFSLLVVKYYGKDKFRQHLWECLCDCGKVRITTTGLLKNGKAKSCGCMVSKYASRHTLTHGMSYTKEWRVWKGIKSRCFRKKDKCYKDYGGRGITICDRWKISFENFFLDMGYRPSKNHSIERIDNNGNYEPSNCRWATMKEQCRNRRNSNYITYDNKTYIISEWARLLGVNHSNIYQQLKRKSPYEVIEYYVNKKGLTID